MNRETLQSMKTLIEASVFGSGDVNPEYSQDIEVLRAIYVPYIILAMHDILFSTRQWVPEYLYFLNC